ncbi:MAG: SDR family oxidoreductase [Sphaerochaetaceae bacterium]|nr:SDR family oxidoreductase [Sphaerochaetaceae bacterium]
MTETSVQKRVLITGGASGIGRLLAVRFADAGWPVIVWDINKGLLDTLEAEGNTLITPMLCDITDREEVYKKADEVQKTFGALDILINNAGIVSGKPLLQTSDAEIEATIQVNLLSLFWVTKAFLPAMVSRKSGHLVTIASAAGLVGVKGLVDYSATKFAAVGFNESLRMEYGGREAGIATTVVCPFFIDTGMFRGVKTRFPLLLPIMQPEYVADKIVRAVKRKKKILILPFFVRTLFILRLFPLSFFDRVAGFFGINRSMDQFTGRKGGETVK